MLIHQPRARVLPAALVICWAANAFCAPDQALELRSLLQAGVDRGYPGIAMRIQFTTWLFRPGEPYADSGLPMIREQGF